MIEIGAGHAGTQAEAAQVSSPRARDDRMTGSACCDAVAAQPGQQALDHAAVHGAEDGVGAAGVAEGALLGDDRGRLAPVLGVRGEAVGRQCLGDDVHGGAHRALSLPRGHARGERATVLLADLRGHLLRLLGPEPLHGFAEQPHQEVVAPLHQPERQLLLDAEEALGRTAGPGGVAPGLHPQVAPVDETLEVVPGDVGMERERGRDLGRGRRRVRRGHGGRCRAGSDRRMPRRPRPRRR